MTDRTTGRGPATPLLGTLLADLEAESLTLDALVTTLPDAAWALATPAPGWTIAHQIAHLAWTDQAVLTALAPDPAALHALVETASTDPDHFTEAGAAKGAALPPGELLAHWRTTRAEVAHGLITAPADTRIPWLGPPMSPASMATARLMETWAHGVDIADALGRPHPVTGRLRHIAHLAIRTRGFVHALHGKQPPTAPIRVELVGPEGDLWTWGPPEASRRVTGDAHHFCLLATRRRHRADLDLTAHDTEADHWLDIVQAYAGPPGPGRAPSGPAAEERRSALSREREQR